MSRFHLTAVGVALLFISGAPIAQSPIAMFKFEDAQAAFAQQRHADALQLLADAEREFGEVNPPILYLRILVRHAILESAETLDFNNLERLRADADRYLREYGAVDALRTQLHSQMREVYRVQQSLSGHPADRLSYAETLFADHRFEEAFAMLDGLSGPNAQRLRVRLLRQRAEREAYRDAGTVEALRAAIDGYEPTVPEEAHELRHLRAHLAVMHLYLAGAEAYYERRDYAAARMFWVGAAESGSMPAEARVGLLFQHGHGVQRDQTTSFHHYLRAADAGDAFAMSRVGVAYRLGIGVEADDSAALKWFRASSERGFPTGQLSLGAAYEAGQGTARDYGEAMLWLQRAARQDEREAFWRIGELYRQGQGVPQDDAAAMRAWLRGAELGDATSMAFVAWAYRFGRGVARDLVTAQQWYRRAAEAGNYSAMRALGQYHQFGWVSDKDFAKAVQWYMPVAESGNLYALLAVEGLLTSGGHGLDADPERAAEWHERLFAAGGPNWQAPPRLGTMRASTGAGVWVAPRGTWRTVDAMGPDCKGLIDPTAPDFNFEFRGGRHAMQIVAMSREFEQIDTTLVVRGPDGWHCNDDGPGASGTNAVVVIAPRTTGTYQVWVGTHIETDSIGVRLFTARAQTAN